MYDKCSKMSAKKLKDLSIVEANLRGEGGVDVVTKAQNRVSGVVEVWLNVE